MQVICKSCPGSSLSLLRDDSSLGKLTPRDRFVIVDADHADGAVAFATEVHDEHVIVEDVELVMGTVAERGPHELMVVPAVLVDEALLCQLIDAVANNCDDLSELLVGVFAAKGLGRFPEPIADLDRVTAHCPTSSGVRPRSVRMSPGIA